MTVDEPDCQEIERLFAELLDNVGAVTLILDCTLSENTEARTRFLQLARESSARGTLTLKKLLWHWSGLRKHEGEEKTLLSPEAIVEALKAEIRRTKASGVHTLLPLVLGRTLNHARNVLANVNKGLRKQQDEGRSAMCGVIHPSLLPSRR